MWVSLRVVSCLLILLEQLLGFELLLLEVLAELLGALLALSDRALAHVLDGLLDMLLLALADGLFQLLRLKAELAAAGLGVVLLADLLHEAFVGAVDDLVGERLAELLLLLALLGLLVLWLLVLWLLLLVRLLHLLANVVGGALEVISELRASVLVLDLLVLLLLLLHAALLLLLGLLLELVVDAFDVLLHLTSEVLVAVAGLLNLLLRLDGGLLQALLLALGVRLLQVVEVLRLLLTRALLDLLRLLALVSALKLVGVVAGAEQTAERADDEHGDDEHTLHDLCVES